MTTASTPVETEASDSYQEAVSKPPQLKSIAHCVYSLRFWQYFALMAFGTYGSVLISYSFKPFGQSSSGIHEPIDDGLLTWAASIGAIINGCMRLVFGNLVDRYSFRLLMSILLTAELFLCFVFYFTATNPKIYFSCIMLNYIVLGGYYTIFPVSVLKVFGQVQGPQIYVQMSMGGFFACLLNLVTTKWVLPATNYLTLYILGFFMTAIALTNLFFIKEELDVERLDRKGALVE